MTGQDVINVLLGVAGFFGVYILKSLQSQLSKVEARNVELTERLSEHEKEVAGDYLKRAEFEDKIERLSNVLFAKLDKISDQIAAKADRP